MLAMFRSVLVIAAHPDDEALGCGGALARLAAQGAEVQTMFLTDGVSARQGVGDSTVARLREARAEMACRAAGILGTAIPIFGRFPDNQMDSVPMLHIAQAIEDVARDLAPDLILTHNPSDLNIDHRLCARAVMTAFRPAPNTTVRAIWGFEVVSSTEWSFGSCGVPFQPNAFMDISSTLAQKIAALEAYAEEMREPPHARSIQAVEALARVRGATVGVAAAEAFTVLRSQY